MGNQAISDAQITSSTQLNNANSAKFARLNLGGWVAGTSDVKQWLQVDLGTYSTVTSVATQGKKQSYWANSWVSSYRLQYSDDGITFHFYRELGDASAKVYPDFQR